VLNIPDMFQDDVLILEEEEEEGEDQEVMPSRRSSRESVLARRSRKSDVTPPSSRTQTRKANGSAGILNRSRVAAVATTEGAVTRRSSSGGDGGLIDLWTETECRLCDRGDFTAESDGLAEHYVTAHFRSKLEAEAGGGSRTATEFPCVACRQTRPRCAAYGSRRQLAVHLGVVHGRAASLLAAKLDLKVRDSRPPAGNKSVKPAVQTKSSERSRDTRTKKATAGARIASTSPEVIELDDESSSQNSEKEGEEEKEEKEEEEEEEKEEEVEESEEEEEEDEEEEGESEEGKTSVAKVNSFIHISFIYSLIHSFPNKFIYF